MNCVVRSAWEQSQIALSIEDATAVGNHLRAAHCLLF